MNGARCCSTDCINKIDIGMHSKVCEPIWFKLGMMINTFEFHILNTNLRDRDHRCEKAKDSAPVILQSCHAIRIEFSIVLKLIGGMIETTKLYILIPVWMTMCPVGWV